MKELELRRRAVEFCLVLHSYWNSLDSYGVHCGHDYLHRYKSTRSAAVPTGCTDWTPLAINNTRKGQEQGGEHISGS